MHHVSKGIIMTEQMEGGSAGTLQLCTLPLELPTMFCTVYNYHPQ